VKIETLREMSGEELRLREEELKEQIFRNRFKKSLGEVDAVKAIREGKKELARVKTLLREAALNINRQSK
jgi:large subunit ribosomal protein L29